MLHILLVLLCAFSCALASEWDQGIDGPLGGDDGVRTAAPTGSPPGGLDAQWQASLHGSYPPLVSSGARNTCRKKPRSLLEARQGGGCVDADYDPCTNRSDVCCPRTHPVCCLSPSEICCQAGFFCVGTASCCQSGVQIACGDGCCLASAVCCGGICCQEGWTCAGGRCVDPSVSSMSAASVRSVSSMASVASVASVQRQSSVSMLSTQSAASVSSMLDTVPTGMDPSPVPASAKTSQSGAIAGGVVGGVAAVVLGAILLFRSHHNRGAGEPQPQMSEPVTPRSFGPGGGRPTSDAPVVPAPVPYVGGGEARPQSYAPDPPPVSTQDEMYQNAHTTRPGVLPSAVEYTAPARQGPSPIPPPDPVQVSPEDFVNNRLSATGLPAGAAPPVILPNRGMENGLSA